MCELYCVCNSAELTSNLTSMELNAGIFADASANDNSRMGQALRHGRLHCTSAVFFDSDEAPGAANRVRREKIVERIKNEIDLSPPLDDLRAKYKLQKIDKVDIGVVVTKVIPNTLAAIKGIREGDVIRRIEGYKIGPIYYTKVSTKKATIQRIESLLQSRENVVLYLDGVGGRRCVEFIKQDGHIDCSPPDLGILYENCRD